MKYGIFAFSFLFCFLYTTKLSAAMSGGDFTIYADTFNFIDTVSTTRDVFSITATGGEFAATSTSDGSIVLRGGFQAAERGILSYAISPSTAGLGTLSTQSVSTASVVLTISTDSETGYSVAVTEDGNLRSGSNDINDVTDGSVTAGVEEYGIRTSGTDGRLASDTNLTGSVTVASAAGRVTTRETTIQVRASIDSNTPAGTYTHRLTFTATVNP